MRNSSFTTVTVYKNPLDYPGMFVARAWETNLNTGEIRPGKVLCVTSNYDDIYELLSETTLVQLMRMRQDDPCILETWI